MKFKLTSSLRGQSDEVLLKKLKRCAELLGQDTITKADYDKMGEGSSETYRARFGSWAEALKRAGLRSSHYYKRGISDDELLENIKSVWITIGKQPSYREVKWPLSQFSTYLYEKRFGSWTKALQKFVDWVNADDPHSRATQVHTLEITKQVERAKRRTRREINGRQRFRIMVRDGFRCRKCGRSPLTKVGVELHVDHVLPWSKGGETVDENLETKCMKCNLGKGNAFDL
ncbi:MAG: HNH endonuclease [Acidobacteria bacterium]|nr:HNH endonuclease [Acidobacteriota bacterium]